MAMRWLLPFAALAAASAGDVLLQPAVRVEGWELQARSDPAALVRVMVSLKNRDMQQLSEEVLTVSSPTSPRYGQHLTPAEIAALTAPEKGARDAVEAWLAGAGIQAAASRWGDRFEFQASAVQIEQLFSTEVRQLSDGSASLPQAGDLRAPEAVAPHIAAVFGLHGIPAERLRAPPLGARGAAEVTPDLLAKVYNITGAPEVSRGTKNRRAVVEFQGQYAKQEDLSAFFKKYVPAAKEGDDKYTCVPGTCEPEGHEHVGTETMLDVEYIMGAVPGIKTEVWLFASAQFCTDMKNWTTTALDHSDPPLVFSVSYGIQGNVSLDKRMGCSPQVLQSIEDDLAKLAARGVSVMISSGDDGSAGGFFWKQRLWPSWPASAPFVTSVGATQFLSGSSGPEQAVRRFGSGGGFDWRYAMQPWQKDAVAEYLARPDAGLPSSADFNRGGRATPEVSALGLGYQVVVNGHTMSIGGTSASAPFFASLVSLLNEARVQQGKSPLGFLNPLIYEMGKAGRGFRDVTVGNNRKDRGGIPFREGYSCTKGWDPVTGWGTPNFQDLLSYVQTLPSGTRASEVIV